MMNRHYQKDKHMSKSACWRRRELSCLIDRNHLAYISDIQPVIDADGC